MSPFQFAEFRESVRVFCFLDLEHPAVAWAVMRGMLVSADYAGYTPPSLGFISFMQAGILETLNNRRLFNEELIERVRLTYFAQRVSRIRGMFFFRSRDDALAKIGDPAWPPYFEEKNLLELKLYYKDPLSDVDANWITFAPLTNEGRITISDLNWIFRYWAGEKYNERPVWERIASGVALVLDEKVRQRCDRYMKEFFPAAHIPILMARLASEAGTLGGNTAPFLSREDDIMRLTYTWRDAEFHDLNVIEAIHRHPDSRVLGRMMAENETWNLPDFRPWNRAFVLGKQNVPELQLLQIPSIHHPN